MDTVLIKIVNTSTNELPSYATTGAAGMDIRASNVDPIELQPLQRALIPTGMFMEIPAGFEVQIRPRSGLAIKSGITCLNSPGTIDSDYRGEVKVILANISNEVFTVHQGDRIAQMIVAQVQQCSLQLVNELGSTERGEGGFGHTGKQ
jgi:dUTP pyrophosphatase